MVFLQSNTLILKKMTSPSHCFAKNMQIRHFDITLEMAPLTLLKLAHTTLTSAKLKKWILGDYCVQTWSELVDFTQMREEIFDGANKISNRGKINSNISTSGTGNELILTGLQSKVNQAIHEQYRVIVFNCLFLSNIISSKVSSPV